MLRVGKIRCAQLTLSLLGYNNGKFGNILKNLYRIPLVAYLLFLLWLVLFKLSSDPLLVLATHGARSLNFVPFAGYSEGGIREMVSNFIVFVPFGLLLQANFWRIHFRQKLLYLFAFSATAEMLQFAFAIGISDITDVITNTLGGMLGLMAYGLACRYVSRGKLDRFIAVTLLILLVALILLRFLVFKVRY
jgi:glycopeptide antibiotics resistance protein